MPWLFLLIAGLFEIGFAISMKLMDGHRNIPWTIVFYVSIIGSFGFLQMAARDLPIGTAYAVWTGIGAIGTAIIGMTWLGDSTTTMRILCLVVLVIALVGLKATSGPAGEP